MAGWRTSASVLVTLAVAGAARAQTYSLAEAPLAGKYFRIRLNMTLRGELRVQQEGKKVALKQEAKANHDCRIPQATRSC